MFSFSGSKAETEAVDVQESQEYDPHEERQVEHPTRYENSFGDIGKIPIKMFFQQI